MTSQFRTDLSIAIGLVLLAVAGYGMPTWILSVTAIALAKGLVAIGMLLLLRAGLVPFGHAMYFCIGGYAVGIIAQFVGIRDIFLLLAAAGCSAGLIAWAAGFLLRRYRGIFFAMLSMALSMILYGILVKSQSLGSSDGFSVPRPTILGLSMAGASAVSIIYLVIVVSLAVVMLIASRYLNTTLGHIGPAVRLNELRIEYLGYSPQRLIHLEYVASGFLGGLAGGAVALFIGQIDPGMGFWTTSGEFVFMAILAGTGGVWGAVAAAFVLELVHTLAFNFAPQYWKFVLGGTLLVLILRFPGGLSSIRWRRRPGLADV